VRHHGKPRHQHQQQKNHRLNRMKTLARFHPSDLRFHRHSSPLAKA
jgi:hypothetical protein